VPRPGPHLLRRDYDGLSFRDSDVIALDPGWLQAKAFLLAKFVSIQGPVSGLLF
jgi:hypothetical protein